MLSNDAVRAEIVAQGAAMEPLVEVLRTDLQSRKLPRLRADYDAVGARQPPSDGIYFSRSI